MASTLWPWIATKSHPGCMLAACAMPPGLTLLMVHGGPVFFASTSPSFCPGGPLSETFTVPPGAGLPPAAAAPPNELAAA